MADPSKYSRPASMPRQGGGSVLDRIALFNKMANEAKNSTVGKPILPTKQYRPASFTKKFQNTSNTMTDTELYQSTQKQKKVEPKEETIPITFPSDLKYASYVNGKTQKQLTDEFERLYLQNPSFWDSVIDSTRFILRYGEFEGTEESLAAGIDDPVPSTVDLIHTFSYEIMNEINKVRQNPVAYAAVVQSRFERFVDDHVYRLQSGEYMKTVEGQEGENSDNL